MNNFDEATRGSLSRRALLARAGATGAGVALLAGCGGNILGQGDNPPDGGTPNPPAGRITDADVLNFALNLEYLEAEYYLRGAFGTGLAAGDVGAGAGAVTGGRQVPFGTPAFRQYAEEIARDEEAHVRFLRSALGGAAVARPAIDLQASFNAAAQAAGIGSAFDPFADETSFLLGAFLFEDVGVTAYMGAVPLLTNKDFLEAAAGIHAVEAYHAGEIRTVLQGLGGSAVTIAQQISDLRDTADGPADKDQGIVIGGSANLVPADNNAIAFSRSTSEILRIVYLQPSGPASRGGFFPNGLNGTITAA